jgi:hypothetical protein
MIILFFVLVLAIAGIFFFRWSKKNLTYTPSDKGSVINKICYSLPDGFQVDSYQNQSGEYGGFIAYSLEATGASTYYFDAKGHQIDSASGVELLKNETRRKKLNDWAMTIQSSFPIKTKVTCGK